MTPDRWQHICAVFNSALEQPASEQDEFLHRACGDDAGLYEEVCRMLQQHRDTGPLDHPLAAAASVAGPARRVSAGPQPVFHDGQTVAGRYQILRYLNRGGMGEVYEARDLDLEQPETVALKTLLPAIAADESMIVRFKREIALSRKIAHPNVCRVYDLARHEDPSGRSVLFLTMEFLAGETLEAAIRRNGAMNEAEALPLLRQMASALDASHEAGVIHRDLKPSNVMLVPASGGPRVVVTDFGLARRFVGPEGATETLSNAIVGTVDYMAPQLLTGAQATFASDVYAFGMSAYKMVTGTLPFARDTPMAAAIQRSRRAVPSPRILVPGLDEKWEHAILRALDTDPDQRFARAGDFIEAVLGNEVTPAPRRISRRTVAIAAVAVLALAGGVAAWREWISASHRLPPEALALYQKGVADNAAGAWFAATKALDEAAKLAPRAPQVRARLAEAWVGLDMPEKAAEEMLLVRRQDSSGLSMLDRLQIEAIDLSITRDFAASAAKYEEMARAGADVSVDLGRAYENAGHAEDAIKSYRRAAEGPNHNPAAWLRLGVLYARQSNAAKSSEAFAQADRLYQLTSNLEGLTELSLQQGIAANARGQLDSAAVFLTKARDTAHLVGNLQQEINATLRLGTNAYMSGASEEADRYSREALDTARSHHLDALATRGLVNLGNTFRLKQDFTRSEQYLQEALTLAGQTHAAHLTALSTFSLAALHSEMGLRDQAVREARDALAFYQANSYAKESLQCLTIISRAQRDSGDYEGALASFRGSLKIAERTDDRAQLSLAHEGIGSMLFNLERYPEALEEYRKSLSFANNAQQVGYAALGCGNALWRLGQYPEAETMFARADAGSQRFAPMRLGLMYGRARMALSRNRFPEAVDMARDALSSGLARTPALQNELELILGLALIGKGNRSEGARKCEAARAGIEARNDIGDSALAGVAVLNARIEQGERKSALQLFDEVEPRLAAYPELQWQALALASVADPRYAARAREALRKLYVLWGDSAYTGYLTRPDVGKLSRPLLPLLPALQK